MSRLRSFLRAGPAERRSLVTALAGIVGVRLLLWVLPYRMVRGLLESTARPSAGASSDASRGETADRIARDVARAARVVPHASCLVQALAAAWLITRSGGSATLRLGVARRTVDLEAHAWLETEGRVILGGEEARRFTPLVR